MKAGLDRFRPTARVLLAAVPTIALSLSAAADDITLSERDGSRVIGSAVAWHHQKEVQRKVVEAACYFDPEVENTMRCRASWGGGGTDRFRMQQRVKRSATKQCKQAGGRKCILFWRNGALRFEGVAPVQVERFETAMKNITSDEPEALPLPQGVGVGDRFRDRFEEIRDYWEGFRKKNRGRNAHYALCANDRGPWAAFSARGTGVHLSAVRSMCVLKCTAISRFADKAGMCYVVYEDGEFASSASEQAIVR